MARASSPISIVQKYSGTRTIFRMGMEAISDTILI